MWAQLVGDVAIVDVGGDGAHAAGGKKGFEVFDRVVHLQANDIALADALLVQPGRQALYARGHLAVGVAGVADHQRVALGNGLGGDGEQVGEAESARIHDVSGVLVLRRDDAMVLGR